MNRRFKLIKAACGLLLCFAQIAVAQTITLQLKKMPIGTLPESVFVAGNFNSWNPADTNYRFNAMGKLVIKPNQEKIIQFKCTKGSWASVEVTEGGTNIANRIIIANRDTLVYIDIEGWNEATHNVLKISTALPQVSVLDTAFSLSALGRSRTIRLYLPPNYHSSGLRYPVLYMHDGQNLFDTQTAAFGVEWKVDETLDSLYRVTGKSCIVVGIDNGGEHRIREYNPYTFGNFGKGEGDAYLKDIVTQLKPFIDKHFRTKASVENTWIAGSSMGGVISMKAILRYPKVFGAAGIFSPAFWTALPMLDDVNVKKLKHRTLFFYAGGSESETMVPYTLKMSNRIPAKAKVEMVVKETGRHEEAAWAASFHQFLKCLFSK